MEVVSNGDNSFIYNTLFFSTSDRTMNNINMIKAIHQWVVRYGMDQMPEDIEEWYDEEIGTTEPDYILGYSEDDVQDELSLIDSYDKISHNEDRENSQQFALELMEGGE